MQLAVLAFVVAASACQPVEGDRIRARDLAQAISEFTALPPETPLAYTPAPGAERVFHSAELRRLALRYGLNLAQPSDVCFAIPMHSLQPADLVAAMQHTPGFARAAIEIVEFSRFPVPAGVIQFPRQGLGTAPESGAGALWNGYVDYGANRRFPIWVRARISVQLQKVVATADLHEGQIIEAGQVRLEDQAGSPAQSTAAVTLDQVIGRVLRRSVPKGAAIPIAQLAEPNDINRGDTVEIEVHSGAARLSFSGRAESAGRIGQRIQIRDQQSGRTFLAEITAKGKAVVTAAGAQ